MTRARPGLLFFVATGTVLVRSLLAGGSVAPAEATAIRLPGTVVLILTQGSALEDVIRVEDVRALTRAGGAGLLTTSVGSKEADPESSYGAMISGTTGAGSPGTDLVTVLDANEVSVCVGRRLLTPAQLSCEVRGGDAFVLLDARSQGTGWQAAAAYGALWRRFTSGSRSPGRSLVMVASPAPSPSMENRGDKVTPLVMALGNVRSRIPENAPLRGLRSDTTRQSGLVANVDVAPTILDFFGIPIPKEMTGQPIRVDGTTDLWHLHQLHLDQRRIRLPIQLGELAFVVFLGMIGIAALIWLGISGSLPGWASRSLRFLAVCGAALPIPLMAGGLLPRLTYPVVVPFLVLSVVALAAAALAARWPGPMGAFRFLGAVGLAFVVLDAVFGWRGARIPLIGGTMFDGVRFYGLPNSFIALLLASALFVAVGLEPFAGFLLLLAAGLFAGFPDLGANVGAAITLFVAAGVWWALRTRRRFGVREVAFVAGTAAVGLAAVLLANRYLPGAPTHITGFVERTGGIGGTWDTVRRRLDVGFGQIADVPAAVIPLIGLLIVLGVVIARPAPIRWGLDLAGRVWRETLIAMTVAGIAAFLLNDTGVAAAAPVFLYAMTATAYPAFLAARRA